MFYEHPSTLRSMSNLALILMYQGRYEMAEEMQLKKMLGSEHSSMLTSMDNLALVLDSQSNYKAAEEMHQWALQLKEKVLDLQHLEALRSMNNLTLDEKDLEICSELLCN